MDKITKYWAWKYCPDCGKAIGIVFYPFSSTGFSYQDDIEREIAIKMESHFQEVHSSYV